jgi:hypothetical protein
MFDRCPLECYYHYHASWGGWESSAEARTVRFYELKKSLPLETIAFESWVDALKDALPAVSALSGGRGAGLDLASIARSAVYAARRRVEDFPTLEARRCAVSAEEADSLLADSVRRFSAELAESPFIELFLESEPLEFLRYHTPASFILDGIRVWTNPLLISRGARGISVFNILPEKAPLERIFLRGAVDAAFAAELARTPLRDDTVATTSIVLASPEFPVVRERIPHSSLQSFVRQTTDAMLAPTKLDTDIREELFPPTDDPGNCANCRFLHECRGTSQNIA